MRITCPTCAKQLLVPETAAGKKVKCPSCSTVIQVPEEHIATMVPPPLPVPESVDEPPQRRPRDADEEDLPRSRRRLEEDFDDDEEFPRSRRRREDDDEEDDLDDDRASRWSEKSRGSRTKALGRAAAICFMSAGVVTVGLLSLNIASNLILAPQMNGGGMRGNDVAYNTGRLVGLLGCGGVGVLGVIYQFMAAASLKSFTGKGKVVTAIVFCFLFGLLFAAGVVINVLALPLVVEGRGLVMGTIILGAITAAVNLGAGILGIVTLNNPAVSKRFRKARNV